MPVIRLDLADVTANNTYPQSFRTPQGVLQRLPRLRLRTQIRMGSDPVPWDSEVNPTRPFFPALVDTGAWISVFPRSVWERFATEITWLDLNPDEVSARSAEQQAPTLGGMTGGGAPYRLGCVPVAARDLWRRSLPAIPVTAAFRLDVPSGSEGTVIVLGLWEGILQGRRLWCGPTVEAFDPDPPPGMLTHRTYGQRWWLSDAG